MEAALHITDNAGETPVVEEYELKLGRLNSSDTALGVRVRLEHLGIDCGETEEDFSNALPSLQRRYDALEVTGETDKKTISKLKELHLS